MANTSRHGMVGWQEFESNRQTLLASYHKAKLQNASRPVQTEHGVVGEAALRKWLSDFLPQKYGVTAGYIVPDMLQPDAYKLYEYDVIIFEAQNAPILWINENDDQSEHGRRRAIPARFVRAVIEVKATFTSAHIRAAFQKIAQLNSIRANLPSEFWSGPSFSSSPTT